ncbi:MAG: triose-phosphate isomerase [Silvanigrellaceae bacterium]|nr:triose-phosphate isomerase [Silvanigrellaceae bacterium]
MTRKKIIIGNWKMHKAFSQALNDFVTITEQLSCASEAKRIDFDSNKLEIGIAAPSLYLSELSLRCNNIIKIFSQNCHWESEGAFTGEISTLMLKSVRVSGSLVGHSERRLFCGETDTTAGKRLGALLKSGLKAVLCVGENLVQREKETHTQAVQAQILTALQASQIQQSFEFLGSDPQSPLFAIAYEPIWAIGTGKTASHQDIESMHAFISEVLQNALSHNLAAKIPILYGGSVKPTNSKEILSLTHVDGALVGGASLVPDDFLQLILSSSAKNS